MNIKKVDKKIFKDVVNYFFDKELNLLDYKTEDVRVLVSFYVLYRPLYKEITNEYVDFLERYYKEFINKYEKHDNLLKYHALLENSINKEDYMSFVEQVKNIVEKFYHDYDKEISGRLGIVYTPIEIVDFMIRISDELCKKHFNKSLGSTGVRIHDYFTGTGIFMEKVFDYIGKENVKKKVINNDFTIIDISLLNCVISRGLLSMYVDNNVVVDVKCTDSFLYLKNKLSK